jgi:hypothetical protein
MSKTETANRFTDEIEAWLAADEWINSHTPLPDRVECYGLRLAEPTATPNGGVKVVWDGPKLLGVVTVVRDNHNFSLLSICEGGDVTN